MARSHIFKRLNRHPKHSWSMLRIMVSDLILQERIVTTKPRAKVLCGLINKVFALACRGTDISFKKASEKIWKREAYDKLVNNLVFRFRRNFSGVVRVTPVHQRLNDKAEMYAVEFVRNPNQREELLKNKAFSMYLGVKFSDWEQLIRKQELEHYQYEEHKYNQMNEFLKPFYENYLNLEKNSTAQEKYLATIQQEHGDIFGSNTTDIRNPKTFRNPFDVNKPTDLKTFIRYQQNKQNYFDHLKNHARDQLFHINSIKNSKRAEKYDYKMQIYYSSDFYTEFINQWKDIKQNLDERRRISNKVYREYKAAKELVKEQKINDVISERIQSDDLSQIELEKVRLMYKHEEQFLNSESSNDLIQKNKFFRKDFSTDEESDFTECEDDILDVEKKGIINVIVNHTEEISPFEAKNYEDLDDVEFNKKIMNFPRKKREELMKFRNKI